jgi:CheY-like chemotaxis protein
MRARIDRERAEAAARDAEHQRTERLKDEFLATLAHELRTPLMSLMVASDSLERIPVQDPATARLHGLIHSQLAHLCRLVDDSLDVARFTQGKMVLRPETVDLREVVRRAVELSQAAIDAHGIDVTVALPAEPVSTYADAVRVAQAVSNVVNNAAKFSHWGGKVAVSLETAGGQAAIRVRDWGRGIPRAYIEQIFDPFVQSEVADTWRGGLGIGLALVRKLVELHGGHVDASSAGNGQGAEFTLTLPLTAAPADVWPDDDVVDPGERAAPPIPRRVLVVDDSPEVRNAVQLMLQLAGHSVVTADCGRAALLEIERSSPDIVLVDIDLPDVDGYAVATTVRAAQTGGRRPHLVAITGKVGPVERDKALRTGFDAHVPKPIDGPTLIRIVAGARDPGTGKSESPKNQ